MLYLLAAGATTLYSVLLLGWTIWRKVKLEDHMAKAYAEFEDDKARRVIVLSLHRNYLTHYDPRRLIQGAHSLRRKAERAVDEDYELALRRWADVLTQLAIALKRLEIYQELVHANSKASP